MRIEFEDGDWIELRERVLFGDIRYSNSKGPDELTQTAALLERMITRWSYERIIDMDGIDALPLEVVTRLGEEVQRFTAPLTKEASRPLENGSISSTSPSTDTEGEPASPALVN